MRERGIGSWALVGMGIGLLVIGCAAGVQLAREGIADPGQLLFNGHTRAGIDCYRCHNGDGRGAGRGPDLSRALPKMPDAAVLEVIAQGATFMPAYGDKLDRDEQRQILAWLRAAFGGPEMESAQPVEAEAVP